MYGKGSFVRFFFHTFRTGQNQCIDYIRQVLGLDGFIAYCKGNVTKYNHRASYKGNPLEDTKKARWYLDKMIEAQSEKYK